MIDECDVLVAISTARHPIYQFTGGIKQRVKFVLKPPAPLGWTVPPWILQEMGYALKANKHIVVFREPGIELPGLQGDLEYIEFLWSDPSDAFRRANEMLASLIGKRQGITVETIARVASPAEEPRQVEAEAIPAQQQLARGPSISDIYHEMVVAVIEKDLTKVKGVYERGLRLIREQVPNLELTWRAYYERARFAAGDADGLVRLKSLQEENPNEAKIAVHIGRCFSDFGQHEDAARQFELAASLSEGETKAQYVIQAGESLRNAKKYDEAIQALVNVINRAPTNSRAEVLRALYDTLIETGKTNEALGIAELALSENPGHSSLRFRLGLECNRSRLHEISLYHYKLICENEPDNASARHNLALAYCECDMPILGVENYKRAFESGETLSASNLGYKYLDGGMADEATGLFRRASKLEGCVPEVARCLAAVNERREKEAEQESGKLAATRGHREFLAHLGRAFLAEVMPAIDGVWSFPFGEISIKLTGKTFAGEGQRNIMPPSPHSLALAGLGRPGPPAGGIELFHLSGEVRGRVGKFKLDSEIVSASPASPWWGPGTEKKEGYILFSADGETGEIAQPKDGKLHYYYAITKARK
jgi:tetratricopeptide (TPR) repeat protein